MVQLPALACRQDSTTNRQTCTTIETFLALEPAVRDWFPDASWMAVRGTV